MTLAELIERLQWQQEGRLQYRKGMACDGFEWFDWSAKSTVTPTLSDCADIYRRRPDPAPMPDEVWLPSCAPSNLIIAPASSQDECKSRWPYASKYVRYIRAGAIIPASQIEVRRVGYGWETTCQTNEYRIKS